MFVFVSAVPGLEGCGVVQNNNGTSLANGQRVIVFFDARNGQGSWQVVDGLLHVRIIKFAMFENNSRVSSYRVCIGVALSRSLFRYRHPSVFLFRQVSQTRALVSFS